MSHCSPQKPWGIHPAVRNDEQCPRCGWTAPGPRGDALARAGRLGWEVLEGGGFRASAEALAA